MNENKPVDIVGFLWKNRRYAAVGLIVAIAVGVVGLMVTRPVARPVNPSITLLIGQPAAAESQPQAQSQTAYYTLAMGSLARMATTERVLAPVAAKHGLNLAGLQPLVAARMVPSSQLLEIRYRGEGADQSRQILDDIAASLVTESHKDAFKQSGAALTLEVAQPASLLVEASVTAEADAAASSISSKSAVTRLAMVGGAALLVGAAATVLLVVVDGRRRKARAA